MVEVVNKTYEIKNNYIIYINYNNGWIRCNIMCVTQK